MLGKVVIDTERCSLGLPISRNNDETTFDGRHNEMETSLLVRHEVISQTGFKQTTEQ
jgi:hypothetical protein